MKTIMLVMILAMGCTRGTDDGPSSEQQIAGHSWKAYYYAENGIADPTVAAQEPTFEFRSNGKIYFSQINPVFRDTLDYLFLDNTSIKLTKPWINASYVGNMTVELLNATDFNFSITDNQHPDIDTYKTRKL